MSIPLSAMRRLAGRVLCPGPCPAAWLAAAASGVCLGLAFPGRPHGLLAGLHQPLSAWVGLVPLLATLRDPQCRQPFRLGWICGTCMALVALYWVAYTQGGGLAVVGGTGLMAAYLGVFTGLYAKAQHLLLRRWQDPALLAAPMLWVAQEYALSAGELGFPWLLLGHSQAALPRFVQYASVTGVWGVSAWVVGINVLVLLVLRPRLPGRRRLALGVALGALIVVPLGHGAAVLASPVPAGDRVRVAVVQPNLPWTDTAGGAAVEQAFLHLEQLSARAAAAADSLDLIVWPESAVPCYVGLRPECRNRLQTLTDRLQVSLLAGGTDYDSQRGESYNAAFLLRPHQQQLQRYAKMHLVPFGERTPFRDRLSVLRGVDWSVLTGELGPAEFARGTERTVFALPAAPFVSLICFEAVFPDLTRRSVGEGGLLMVNITNDSWFGDSPGPYQHAQLTAMRAIENRTPMVRCASTGISQFVDARGRVTDRMPLGTGGHRIATVALGTGGTFYTRHGDVLAQAALAGSLSAVLLAWARSRGAARA